MQDYHRGRWATRLRPMADKGAAVVEAAAVRLVALPRGYAAQSTLHRPTLG